MTRLKIVLGNWKMDGTSAQLAELRSVVEAAVGNQSVEVVACLPDTLLDAATRYRSWISLGAQDCHSEAAAAFTGCVSASMLAAAGASFVLLRRSEMRRVQLESDAHVQGKVRAATASRILPVISVGEDWPVRPSGEQYGHVREQLVGITCEVVSQLTSEMN